MTVSEGTCHGDFLLKVPQTPSPTRKNLKKHKMNPLRYLGRRVGRLGKETATWHREDEGEEEAPRKMPSPNCKEGAFDEHVVGLSREEHIREMRAPREMMRERQLPSGADASDVKRKWRALMIQIKEEGHSSYDTSNFSPPTKTDNSHWRRPYITTEATRRARRSRATSYFG